ncbi:C-terminal region of Pasteurella multocida toxin residues 569-1285 [Pseudomonas antarctica]|uniref:C-terminal region of Pasteurella multocida toxin residues 569-1285 n=1 Tax=Pseudomonas antarctica TaxID=219572 RepID=A0A1G9XLD7_9PSED|nr:membrane-targeted effector domain-containing toxin [Pseudomonas antarctica]KAF2410059.1 dermonecrotic toxin [Pseudomonas antarctica]SDM97570.1 C-terminal region of Pasteurella multocida toxin residues 569-1285 [Pseudomonas antarctica]
MSLITNPALPNATDKAALKALATRLIQACPSLHDSAHQSACEILKKHGVQGLDPDEVYYHRFKAAQSSSKSFTGWEHVQEKPYESTTLTQLVIKRFRATDYDNADLLDLYGGFYTAGPEFGDFNETHEVRLHGNEVLKDFWRIKFDSLYTDKLDEFWHTFHGDFRALAKCNFLSKAVQAVELKQLTDDDFQTCLNAVASNLSWPVTQQMLETEVAPTDGLQVCALDVDGYVAINLLRIVDKTGRQILYTPGDTPAFQVLETPSDMHWWVLGKMNEEKNRNAFLCHFSLTDRQAITDNITDLMNRLVGTWGSADHHLINRTNQAITHDAFTWLQDRTRWSMYHEAQQSLTTQKELTKKLWIGYLSAGLKIFGPLAVIGWPVALPVLGASIANLGLNIDQAVNGRTSAERKAGVIGAVFSGIDTLFNLFALHGPGPIAELGPEIDEAEAAEMAKFKDATAPVDDTPVVSPPSETPAPAPDPAPTAPALEPSPTEPEIPADWKRQQGLEGATAMTKGGRYRSIYTVNSNPSTVIPFKGDVCYVRYEADVNGGGTWAIIDPNNPHAFSGSRPVRLNVDGEWEYAPRAPRASDAVRGGSPVDVPTTSEGSLEPEFEPESATPNAYGPPRSSYPPSSLTTPYDLSNMDSFQIELAMSGGPDYFKLIPKPGGGFTEFKSSDYFINPARTKITSDARTFFSRPFFTQTLPERPALPTLTPELSSTEAIEDILEGAPRLIVAESPKRVASLYTLIKQMPALARKGFKVIYLNRLFNDLHQFDLDTFASSGELSENLKNYLNEMDRALPVRFNTLELLTAARANGVRVQATGLLANYLPLPVAVDEQMAKSFLTSEIIRLDQAKYGASKYVVLTNAQNTNTFRGVAGISEINGGTSLRIGEVSDATPRIKIGYGPKVSNVSTGNPTVPKPSALDTDLILQVPLRQQKEVFPFLLSPKKIDELLKAPGDYLLQETQAELTLIHRNRFDALVRNTIQRTASQGYFIDPVNFPRLKGTVYPTLTDLCQALDTEGLKLKGAPLINKWLPAVEMDANPSPMNAENITSGAAFAPQAKPEPLVLPPTVSEIPAGWEANEILDGIDPVSEPGRDQGIYRLNSNPSTAILLNDTAYYVRYVDDVNGSGHWAIINPQNPFSFSEAIPVRLNAEGQWELAPRHGLRGGAGQLVNKLLGRTHTPVLESPAVAYEIPQELRQPLEKAAAGPLYEKYALSDEGVEISPHESDPYAPFKARRQRLFKDAVAFLSRFTAQNRPPVPALPASASTATWLEELLKDVRGIVVGEAHSGVGSKQLLIDNMQLLAQKNVKTLYCEHLLRDFHQAALDTFAETGEMPEALKRYLQSLDIGQGTDPLGQYNFMELVKAARVHEIRIQAIDCLASYRTQGFLPAVADSQVATGSERQALMNYYASTVIRADQAAQGAHKWLALVGNTHVSTYKGVPGLSELEEVNGLRVEDLAAGQSKGVIPDPGIPAAGSAGAVKSDLLLQLVMPRKPETPQDFGRLLRRPGFFTVDSTTVVPTLKHRSSSGDLISTPLVHQNGHFFIERPTWPSMDGHRFDSLKDLFAALERMGMVLVGKPAPL